MHRRQFLHAGALATSAPHIAGCLGGNSSTATPTPAQSGSGNPCDTPRNIDYQAVEEYVDNAVYLENAAVDAHTACVTVTKAEREREETGSTPPPLEKIGYAVQPGKAVEIFRFREPGRYTIEVHIEQTTTTETFEKTDADFGDAQTSVVTFEITDATTITVTEDPAGTTTGN
jgi:hypothetical protein